MHKKESQALCSLLSPFSRSLHYLEGNSVPASHVLPIYNALHIYATSLPADVKERYDPETITSIINAVEERWLGATRKEGLKHQAHLAAFFYDPYVREALRGEGLINDEVREAAINTLKHMQQEKGRDGMLQEEHHLYASGNVCYASLLDGVKDIVVSMKEKSIAVLVAAGKQLPENEVDRVIFKLKNWCLHPSTFWQAAKKAGEEQLTGQRLTAHLMFTEAVLDLSTIVPHSCGTERAGKGYGLVQTKNRCSFGENNLMMAIYIYWNHCLVNQDTTIANPGMLDFVSSMVDPGEVEELRAAIEDSELRDDPSGSILDISAVGEESGEDEGHDDATDDEEIEDEGRVIEVAERAEGGDTMDIPYGIPDGFVLVDPQPSAINAALVGYWVLMNWSDWGWALGKITKHYSSARTKNLELQWDSDTNPRDSKFDLKVNGGGDDKPAGWWVLLQLEH